MRLNADLQRLGLTASLGPRVGNPFAMAVRPDSEINNKSIGVIQKLIPVTWINLTPHRYGNIMLDPHLNHDNLGVILRFVYGHDHQPLQTQFAKYPFSPSLVGVASGLDFSPYHQDQRAAGHWGLELSLGFFHYATLRQINPARLDSLASRLTFYVLGHFAFVVTVDYGTDITDTGEFRDPQARERWLAQQPPATLDEI